jgi:hypothetical protein
MSDAYLIETDDEVAGILVRGERGGFRFHAVVAAFTALEQQNFATPWKAERAATLLARSRQQRAARRRA